MSAGSFNRSRYLCTEDSRIYKIRVQPETLTASFAGASNAAAPAPTITGGDASDAGTSNAGTGSVRVGGANQLGIRARSVTIVWTGVAPAGYKPEGVVKIPVLVPATFNTWKIDSTGTYLGVAARILGKQQEQIK